MSKHDPFVGVVVSVPEELFSDDDEICLTACEYVCQRLESHLQKVGHQIPAWIHGGCAEDWGVYLQSTANDATFEYSIGFFDDDQILVQYGLYVPFLKKLFRKAPELESDDPIHEAMRSFGALFNDSRMIIHSELP